MPRRKGFPKYINEEGVLMVDNGTRTLLNYLMEFKEHGIFEPNYGKCPESITKEMADTHNKLLDQMLITGLDESCQIGQGNMFYFHPPHEDKPAQVRTFLGTVISDRVYNVTKTTFHFTRKTRDFIGFRRKDSDLTFVKRTA